MRDAALSFEIALADFDLARLPIDRSVLEADPRVLASAVQAYFEDCFKTLGGSTAIAVRDGKVSVTWFGASHQPSEAILDHAVHLLGSGEFNVAEPLLRSLLASDPKNRGALYNLGMMLSDQGKLSEALEHLEDFINLEPSSSVGWTALGVAQNRHGEKATSIQSFRQAVELDEQNAYALRNLAAALVEESPEEALPLLTKAVRLMPSDQATHFGLAQCLLTLGKTDLADNVLKAIIDIDSFSQIAERARTLRTKISHENLRSGSGDGINPAAVEACRQAIALFDKTGPDKCRTITFEIAVLGRSGLDINDPDPKYRLKSTAGDFTGLQLVAMMYVGLKRLAPDADPGIDLSKEYAMALDDK